LAQGGSKTAGNGDRGSSILKCPLFKIDEFVIARISEMPIEPDPLGGIKEGFTGQGPALEIELL
jgi:hypothetical protein